VNIPEVFRFLRRFASPKPSTPRELAIRALEDGRYAEAVALLDELVAAAGAPGDPAERAFLLNKRGVASIGLKEREKAAADFCAALEAVPRFAPALANSGNLLLEDGDVDGAIARYEEAVAADEGYAVAFHNLGVAYKRAGRFGDAVRAMRTAMRLEGSRKTRPTRRA
jgi:tetratricopeptide (TPR) repeat protein